MATISSEPGDDPLEDPLYSPILHGQQQKATMLAMIALPINSGRSNNRQSALSSSTTSARSVAMRGPNSAW